MVSAAAEHIPESIFYKRRLVYEDLYAESDVQLLFWRQILVLMFNMITEAQLRRKK